MIVVPAVEDEMTMILGTDDLVMISTTIGEEEEGTVGMIIEGEEEVGDTVGMEEESIEMTVEEEEEAVVVVGMEEEVAEVVEEEEEEGTEEERGCLKDL